MFDKLRKADDALGEEEICPTCGELGIATCKRVLTKSNGWSTAVAAIPANIPDTACTAAFDSTCLRGLLASVPKLSFTVTTVDASPTEAAAEVDLDVVVVVLGGAIIEILVSETAIESIEGAVKVEEVEVVYRALAAGGEGEEGGEDEEKARVPDMERLQHTRNSMHLVRFQ
eukprot:gene443-biopygen2975